MSPPVAESDTQVVQAKEVDQPELPRELDHDRKDLKGLGDSFKRLEPLPVERRLQAVLDRTAEFCAGLANSSAHPLAIPRAAGIWTFVHTVVTTLQAEHKLPDQTARALSELAFRWALAMVACGEVVNAPDVAIEPGDDEEPRVHLSWDGGDGRGLDVFVDRGQCEFMATWLADDGPHRIQEGDLGLNSRDLEATIRWLRTGLPE